MSTPDEDDVYHALNASNAETRYWFDVAKAEILRRERAEVWCVFWFLMFLLAVVIIVMRGNQ